MDTRHYNFSVIIERDKNGYFVSCPELQGCYSQGDTYEEAMENVRDAIKLHIKDCIKGREKIPRDRSISLSTVEVAVKY